MSKYISLLRGINVSGQKKIKMTELKELYETLNFTNVTTYIQSGNIVFCSNEKDVKKIQKLIEQKIEEIYKFFVPTLVLTENELNKIISKLPFEISEIDTSKFCFVFLDSSPKKSLVDSIIHLNTDAEKFIVRGDVIYFYCMIGFGKTKLTNNFFEKKLKVTATTRNWKTTNKLNEMSKEANCE